MVDVGDARVEVGDEVVLIGRQGDEEITAAEWADAMGTIAYDDRVRHRAARAAPGVSREHRESRRRGRRGGGRRRRGAGSRSRCRASSPRGCATGPTATRAGVLSTPDLRRPRRARRARRRLDLRRRARARVRRSCSRTASRCSVRTWVHQLEALPDAGFRDDRVRPPRPRPVDGRRRAATRSRTSATTCAASLEGLDLRDAVLVGHSMGGVAVQSFVLRHPGGRGRAGRGHRAALDARRTRRSARTRRGLRGADRARSATARPTSSWVWRRRTSASSSPALGFGATRSRATSSWPARCCSSARPRRAANRRRAARPRPHRASCPNVRIPTLVIGGTTDVLTPPARGAADRQADSRRAPRDAPRRRAHADARADRASSTG